MLGPTECRGIRRLMWPAWNQTAIAAAITATFFVVTRGLHGKPWDLLRALVRELTVVLVLYSIWQYVGSLSLKHYGNAFADGRWVWRTERAWHLPGELSLQHLMIRSHAITWLADLFYATVHAPALGIFLIWLWFRHRDDYPRIRNNLALVTGGCLLIQLIPVAPPRMFPGYGFIDTLHVYGPIDVYGPIGRGLSDQFGAMPSVHCAWALIVGVGVVTVSRSRWRWLALLHPIVTFTVVAATGNHWWMDGIVAAGLLVVASVLQASAKATWRWATRAVTGRAGPVDALEPEPALVATATALAADAVD